MLRALAQYQHLIADRQHCGAMGNQDDNRAALLGAANCPEQCRFPIAVKIGVRLIEHDQKRLAVQCPSQRYPLALPGRQNCASLADAGVITLRQPQNHFVCARCLRRTDNSAVVGRHCYAGYILCNGPVE